MEPIKRVMVDLETLGSGPRAAIVSIGACKITDRIIDTFYRVVDVATCAEAGLQIDVATIKWWLQQSQEARDALCVDECHSLRTVLSDFNEFLGDWQNDKDVEIWGNGANFDNVILASSYDALCMKRPWKYSQDRCFRTLRKQKPLVPIPFMAAGEKHHALSDALHQSDHLLLILAEHRKPFKLLESAIADFEKLKPFLGDAAHATAQMYREQLAELLGEPTAG